MPITPEELRMLDNVQEDDFYAPLFALVLHRYATRDKAIMRHEFQTEIPKLIDGAYQDLREYYGVED